jgi:D-3-phosphoglycerate dehydrogenase / 2-oxoglutarate reductase
MSDFRVLITDYAWPSLQTERETLAQVNAEPIVAETGEADELIRLAKDVDAILTCWKPVPPQALDVAENCRIVSRYGIGLDNIPVDHATRLGIPVTNVPDFCLDEVSDHTMALLLDCARQVTRLALTTRSGRWDRSTDNPVPRLRGQTLGLVGYGRIARALVPKALSFGLNLMVYTPRLTSDEVQPWGEAAASLDELLEQSDYVSLHVPLTQETAHMIDADALRRMKPTAYLINTARGAVIDEDALLRALSERWIAGAALDVLSEEPPDPDHPLLSLDNVIITPHAAFYSETSIHELAYKAALHVVQALRGERPDNIVNPEVLSQENCRLPADASTD